MNIKDIARQAGVSISSVSRVMNNKPGVKSDIRNKVLAIIEENDYIPNLLARGLVQKRSRTIGIILPYVHSHWMERIEAIMDSFQEARYSVMLNVYQDNWEKEQEGFQFMLEKQVEGVIYFPQQNSLSRQNLIQKYRKHFPVVAAEQRFNLGQIPQILQDDYSSTCRLMEYIIAQGHEKIAVLCGPRSNYTAKQREKAYTESLIKKGILPDIRLKRRGDYSMQSGYTLMTDILENVSKTPTAVFAMNDLMALGAVRAIHDKGLRIPEDISVAGYDDMEWAAFSIPALTTVRQEHYRIGSESARLLQSLIKGEAVENNRIILEQSLVTRESITGRRS